MHNRKIIITGIIVVLIVISYFYFFKKPSSQDAPTGPSVGTVVGDTVIVSDAQGFKYEDGSRIGLDTKASKISASPSGDRFLAFVDPSSDYPVGQQEIFDASGKSVTLPNDAEQAHWLKDSTFVYTRNDGSTIRVLTNNGAKEDEIFSNKCGHISLLVANSSNVIANCRTPEDLHVAYLINTDTKKSSILNITEDNVVISASLDLNYLLIVDPNKTEDTYSIINRATNITQKLTVNFYPDSIKWIDSKSFLALTDNTNNSGSSDTNLVSSNILMKFSLKSTGTFEPTTLKTFTSAVIDYNIIAGQVVALLANRSKIEISL